MRRMLLALALPAAACATTSTSGGTQEPSARARGEDEEAGLNRITGLMRDFGRALDAKDFESAAALLRDAEGAIKSATEVTRSHPEFEEVETRVARARPRLDQAVERDRIERRNAAIAASTKKGNDLIQRANILLTELAKRVPEPEDMTNLRDLVDELAAVEREGSGFLDDAGYKQHADVRDRVQALVVNRRRQAEWQVQTSVATGKAIELALSGVEAAKKAEKADDKLAALRGAADAFARCAAGITEAASQPGYDDSAALATPLGTLAAADTRKRCLDTGARVRGEADRLAFHQRVSAVARRADEAVRKLEGASAAAEGLASTEAAIEALAACQAELDAARRGPGFDPAMSLDTALGQGLGPDRLRKACGSTRARLVASLPAWRWRTSFETMKGELADVQKRFDEALAVSDPSAQRQAWQPVIEALGGCARKAHGLTRERGADPRYTFVSALGSLTVGGVEKECDRQRVVAEGKLARAVQAQSIEAFAQTCKGDEVEVARREGVPDRVERLGNGRVFVYEAKGRKGSKARRFAFDASGTRVEETVLRARR